MKLARLVFFLALLCPLVAKDKPPKDGELLILDPVKVRGNATSNFAIDIQITVNSQTKKVAGMKITRVFEKSDAEELDLQAGDEILFIDGVPVEGMDPKIDFRSQIGKIFLNREPGDRLKLEVRTLRIRSVTLQAHAPVDFR